MSRYYIKPDRDKDYYVVMSTIAMDWVFAGTAAEVADFEAEKAAEEAREEAKQMLVRADSLGSSSMRGRSQWGSPWVTIGNGTRLRREDLVRYVELTDDEAPEGAKEEAAALLDSYREDD
ncbi:hypothetical protein ACIBCT_35185 [Streptosporangium sp. NPDC050855]|uniref:hypothetical protein n=1 Tax=Streptosporangium sp. NPDC050855 TaxID=3366194 RepID=UPI0037AE731D